MTLLTKQVTEEAFQGAGITVREMTFDGVKGNEKASSVLTETMEQAEKVIELIQHFRGAGRETKLPAGASIYDSVYQVLRAMDYEYPLYNTTILKMLPKNLSPLPLKREHLETILFELILHARQAMGEKGGVLTLEAKEKISDAPVDSGRKSFAIRVSYSSQEIPKADMDLWFEPFTGPSADKGLGLYMVKKIVEYYGGAIEASSSERGTSFSVRFPG